MNEARLRPSALLLGVVLLGTAGTARALQLPPSPVVVAPVVERELEVRFRLLASTVALKRSELGAPVEGWVEERFLEEGGEVEVGEPLVRLRTVTVSLQLAEAEAELRLRREELAEKENGTRPEMVEAARARLSSAEAAALHEQWNVERSEQLYSEKTITEDELRLARLALQRSLFLRDELRAVLAELVAGPRQEAVEQARARVGAQEEAVRLLEDALDKHVIRAPYAGVVSRRDVDVGVWLAKGDVIGEIVGLDPIGVRVAVPEERLGNVRPNGTAKVRFDALPGKVLDAAIVAVVPSADPRAKTFPVRLRLDNPRTESGAHALLPGMSAEVEFVDRSTSGTKLAPKDALVLGGPMPRVWVVAAGQGPAPRDVRALPVKVGRSYGEWIEVEGELSPGDLLVVRGNERLRPGSQVIVTQELAPPPESSADGASDA